MGMTSGQERPFKKAHPGTDEKDFMEELNPDSMKVVTAYVEPSLASIPAGQRFQFGRHGYSVTAIVGHKAEKNRVQSGDKHERLVG